MRISDWSSDVCSSDLWLPYLDTARAAPAWPQLRTWADLLAHDEVSREDFRYEHVAYDHPLWVVFSSGTTGLPKAIVHSHVGALLEHLKLLHFHLNLGPDSVMRSEEHTSELQSPMRTSYAVFCLTEKKTNTTE